MTDPMELVGRLEAYRPRNEWGDPVHHVIIDEAAACIREMVEWRPIETAPRDGALFLSLNTRQNNLMCIVWFHPAYEHFVGTGGQHLYQFTHWLPLPPAPGAEDE